QCCVVVRPEENKVAHELTRIARMGQFILIGPFHMSLSGSNPSRLSSKRRRNGQNGSCANLVKQTTRCRSALPRFVFVLFVPVRGHCLVSLVVRTEEREPTN